MSLNSNNILVNSETGEEISVVLSENEANEVETGEVKSESKWTEEEFLHAETHYDTPLCPEAIDNAVSYGLPFSLFGFSVVFAVLAVIMVIVIAFGKIFGSKNEKPESMQSTVKKEEKKPQNSMVDSVPVVEEVPVAVPAVPVADDKGIVAAIIAAISSFRASNGESGGFRVVSFKKRK